MKQFDVVVGNPPYHAPKTKGKGKGKPPVYPKFVELGMNMLNNGGFIGMVCPPGNLIKSTTINGSNNIWTKFQSGSLYVLNLTAHRYFKVGSLISYFIWSNKPSNIKTKIISNEHILIDITKHEYLPWMVSKDILSILEKASNPRYGNSINFIYRKPSKTDKFVGVRELNHLSNKKGNIKATIECGPHGSYYSSLKVETTSPEHVANFLNSKFFSFINYVCHYNSVLYFGFLNRFVCPPTTVNTANDRDIYCYFELNEREIEVIENTIK